MYDLFLLLGSNLGDRYHWLNMAQAQLEMIIGPIIKKSSVYQTASWGKMDQPDFFNQVVFFSTDLLPQKVLRNILEIETGLGRTRIEKWGSRTIDIDILIYGDKIINEPDLVIPHPYLHERRFALEPLAELAPELIHPVLKKNIKELCISLNDQLVVQKLKI